MRVQRSEPASAVVPMTPISEVILARGVVMYAGTARVPVYRNPAEEFDAQVGTIPFGAMVITGESEGRFTRVVWKEISGWALRDDLADRAADIYPQFTPGEENLIDDVNTCRVRAMIGDEFGLGRSEFPLQAGEYVLYRLKKRGLSIPWPPVRPRMPGRWSEILKGVEGIHIGIVPKVGAIMEYRMPGTEIGHVTYVEAVFPDGTISVTEVNNPDSGIYAERNITEQEWKELRPVFIEVKRS